MVARLMYAVAAFVAGLVAAPAPAGAPVAQLAASHQQRPLVQRLSLQQLAGQRIVYAYAGLKPPASLLAAIRAGEAGGVILFGPEHLERRSVRGVIDQLQQASLAGPLHDRLLILTDQEGGEVRRLPGAPARSEKQIGEAAEPVAAAGTAGTGAGRNLGGVGSTSTSPLCSTSTGSPGTSSTSSSARTRTTPRPWPSSARRSSPRSSALGWPRPPSTSPGSGPRHGARTPISGR